MYLYFLPFVNTEMAQVIEIILMEYKDLFNLHC